MWIEEDFSLYTIFCVQVSVNSWWQFGDLHIVLWVEKWIIRQNMTLFHTFCLLCHSVDHSFYPNGNKSGSVQPSPGRYYIITNVWIKINQRINQIAMKCHVQMRQNRRFRRSFTAWKIQDSETFEIMKKNADQSSRMENQSWNMKSNEG